jgi:rod shape-determining protein MreC
MQNVFLFIRRFLVLLTFLGLQIFCIVLLARSSKSHHTFFAGAYNEVAGSVNSKYSNLTQYFGLKEENQKLMEENLRLRNQLKQNFEAPLTTDSIKADTIRIDSIIQFQKYVWHKAVVVGNTLDVQNNFITLQRGTAQGIAPNMAVVNSDGNLIGKVEFVSANYAKVMSLLNRYNKVSAYLYGKEGSGSLDWDGKDITIFTLNNINKSIKVNKGDTVLTSNFSSIYPPNIQIGFVDTVMQQADGGPTWVIKVKAAANFANLKNAFVVENKMKVEQDTIESKIIKTPKIPN